MIIQESGENYLETILLLQKTKGYVRSIDIAAALNFSKPSISRAMSILRRENYILMEANGNIILTEKGLAKAKSVLERHLVIKDYLEKVLDLPPDIADKDACRIEHIISPETFEKIKALVAEASEQ
ncbi:MAG TPA: metal-dependent transcriptional regulator [Candidatus Avacidaminococcus intestinavium]|uniref:Metal-dependent transcriptional regulator n=1 Tax=Candidatus Avacidaminococcus intestinavium TaxID=2840684 RepID=A0A9D1SLS1_9FIRM|nr:metal-dependent transcriptional regulator [Candidatus Avacidaminococcus intestinavium]